MGITQRDVSPEVWAALAAALPAEPKRPRARKPELVAPLFVAPALFVLPLVTASEANGRDWRARSNRTHAARKATSAAFGPHLDALAPFATYYHAGYPIRVILTRLGGRRLDRSNLTTALKATEDAVALFMGADDGDPRWRAQWEQEPGGPMGVRVELRYGRGASGAEAGTGSEEGVRPS